MFYNVSLSLGRIDFTNAFKNESHMFWLNCWKGFHGVNTIVQDGAFCFEKTKVSLIGRQQAIDVSLENVL